MVGGSVFVGLVKKVFNPIKIFPISAVKSIFMEVCVFPPNNQDQAAEGRHMWPRICEELCTFGTICEYKISQHGNLKVHLAASNIQKESAAKWIIQWICAQQHCKSHFDMRHPVVDRIRPRPSLSPSHDFPENIPNPYHQHWGPSSEKPVRRVFGFSGVDILPSEVQSCATN